LRSSRARCGCSAPTKRARSAPSSSQAETDKRGTMIGLRPRLE
jgi:hypothetical protein